MKTMTAKDLKNRTGDAIRAVSRGEKIVVTLRGKPVAFFSPVTEALIEKDSLRPIEEAWRDIEEALKKRKPKFRSSKEAIRWTRRRV